MSCGLMAGTYRVRFDGENVISFEREITLRAGQVLDVDVSLNPAPEPPPPPAPPPQPAPAPTPAGRVGPKGQVQTIAIPDWLEKEFVGREPRRETILSCSGNERTTMLQLNDPMPQRLYEDADVVYYVVAGEGSVTLDGQSSRIPTSAFISVPRGTRAQLRAARKSPADVARGAWAASPASAPSSRTLSARATLGVGVERVADEIGVLIRPEQQRREHERHRVASVGQARARSAAADTRRASRRRCPTRRDRFR